MLVEVPDEFIAAELEASGGDRPTRTAPRSRAARAAPRPRCGAGRPSVALIATVIAVPMVLILGATFGTSSLAPGSTCCSVLIFLGTPTVALTIAVLLAMYLLGIRRGMTVGELAPAHRGVAASRSA